MSSSTSDDLHPTSGARFVFERIAEQPPAYRVRVFLPASELHEATLAWPDDGTAAFTPPLPPGWAADEALKLARVLHRDGAPAKLVRWRGP